MHIAPEQGQTTSWKKNVDANRKTLSLCCKLPFVASFKTISLMIDFIHIFNDLIHVFSSMAGADNPWRHTLMSIERPYHFVHLLQVSKQSL